MFLIEFRKPQKGVRCFKQSIGGIRELLIGRAGANQEVLPLTWPQAFQQKTSHTFQPPHINLKAYTPTHPYTRI